MLILGITGTRGSGKGVVAQYVAEWAAEHGLLAVDRGFADMLKWAMARIFWPEISREDAIKWANEFKNEPYAFVDLVREDVAPGVDLMSLGTEARITGRELFQHGGTEMGRELFGANFWVEQLLPSGLVKLEFGEEECPAWWGSFLATGSKNGAIPDIGTVSDLRFQNEVVRILECSGEIWKVDRPGFEPDGHASEVPVESRFIDMTVTNDGDLLDLKQEVFDRCDNLQARGMIR